MCTEPESIVPIIATKAKQVVLIGDHKQLRPVVSCTAAENSGLSISLFERYAERRKGNVKLTLLQLQYRMHKEICKFSSRLFYDNKLVTFPPVPPPPTASLWPNPHVPVVLCDIEGVEEFLPFATEDGNELSRSNKEEVSQVIKIFEYLLKHDGKHPASINVMSQYNAQCSELKDALLKEGYSEHEIVVNTVFASQGGEWDFVIFSTVRSRPRYRIENVPTRGWQKENLGFIKDENQTNVALTRAREGLIIVGNRSLLECDDEVWGQLLKMLEQDQCIVEAKNFPPPNRRHHYWTKRTKQMSDAWKRTQLRQNMTNIEKE